MPVIAIELVLVFGGVLLFAWWQLRDLDREKRKREAQKRLEAEPREPGAAPADPNPKELP